MSPDKYGRKSVEQQLIAYGVENGSFDFLFSEGITPDFFETYRKEYYDIASKWNELGTVPSREYVEDKYPMLTLDLVPKDNDIPLLKEEIRNSHVRRALMKTIKDMSDLIEKDEIEEIINTFPRKFSDIDSIVNPVIITDSLSKLSISFNRAMEKAQENNDPDTAMGHPHPAINRVLGGYEPGLYFYMGRPGNGKSFNCMLDAWHVWKKGARVAYFSLEMEEDKMMSRFHTLNTGFSNTGIQRGWYTRNSELDPQEKDVAATEKELEEFRDYMVDLEQKFRNDEVPLFNVIDRQTLKDHITPQVMEAYCREKEIDFVVIDQLNLIDSQYNKDEPEHTYLNRISVDLKKMQERLDIPVLVAHQMNRDTEKTKDPTMANIANSDGPARNADVILYVTQRNNTTKYQFLKMRNGTSDVKAAWAWDFDTGQRKVISPEQYEFYAMSKNSFSQDEDENEDGDDW